MGFSFQISFALLFRLLLNFLVLLFSQILGQFFYIGKTLSDEMFRKESQGCYESQNMMGFFILILGLEFVPQPDTFCLAPYGLKIKSCIWALGDNCKNIQICAVNVNQKFCCIERFLSRQKIYFPQCSFSIKYIIKNIQKLCIKLLNNFIFIRAGHCGILL